MLSQTKLGLAATSISLILWAGFTIALVVWHLGITNAAFLPVALAVTPYAILLIVSTKQFGKRRLWLIVTFSILIGSYGVYQYSRFFIVNLSSLSNVALWQVPLTQCIMLVGGFGLAALWQMVITTRRSK